MFDIVIIGNGAIGMTLALALADASSSTQIAVVGPPHRFGCASLAAGAMINVWAEIEYGCMEEPALAAKLVMARRSLDLWDAHADSLSRRSNQPITVHWGTHVFASSRSTVAEERSFDYLQRILERESVPHHNVAVNELTFLGADRATRPMRSLCVPDGRVNSHAVMEALECILDQLPTCHIVPGSVREIRIGPDGDKILELDEGESLFTQTIVLANGAFAQRLIDPIPELKHTVPRLLFGGGTALDVHFQSPLSMPAGLGGLNAVVRTMDRGAGCGMHLIPAGHGSYYFGSTNSILLRPEEDALSVNGIQSLLQGLTSEFHQSFLRAAFSIRKTGFRPVSIDTFPLLGESDVDGVWFCNGTKRDGFTCAPFLAAEMTKAMAGRAHDLPKMFRPSRPLISYRDRESATNVAVEASMGSDYMNGFRLPVYRWVDMENVHRKKIAAIYDKRNIRDFGIHPEVLGYYDIDELYYAVSPRLGRP
jgi:glycine oxidase